MLFRENCAGKTAQTLKVLRRALPAAALTAEDALVAQHVAQVISNRAAQLVSVCEYSCPSGGLKSLTSGVSTRPIRIGLLLV